MRPWPQKPSSELHFSTHTLHLAAHFLFESGRFWTNSPFRGMRPARCAALSGESPWVERPATLFILGYANVHYCILSCSGGGPGQGGAEVRHPQCKTVRGFLPHRSRRAFSIFKISKCFPFSDFFKASSRKKTGIVAKKKGILFEMSTPKNQTVLYSFSTVFFEK